MPQTYASLEADKNDYKQAAEVLRDEVKRLRAAFLNHLKSENDCWSFRENRPCEAGKCGCVLEMQSYIDELKE
jgi:hypothetical protein